MNEEKILISVDVYGNFACFTNPWFKYDKVTFDAPTPSAIRGLLNAIYSKPKEFYYEVVSIQFLKDIQYIDVARTILKDGRIPNNPSKIKSIDGNEDRTVAFNRYLKDVHYRITAYIVKQPDWDGNVIALAEQFNRRVAKGKCFYQPFLGIRECVAYFEPIDINIKPISLNKDFGTMLYDVFDIRNNTPLSPKNKDEILNPTYYHAVAKNGIIEVPPYSEILNENNVYSNIPVEKKGEFYV